MSNNIDEKVVEMRFDNKHFENNVQETMSTIDKLKQKLNFTGAAKGLDNIGDAAKNVNMTPMANAAETVRLKFSALEVMAVTALQNITNTAINAGKRIVSALTIEPIKTGFQEYETQINAIQTILANTESKGTTLEQVNSALDELNVYADKTIYNFTQMTRNIGTFTAAGVDLETSVSAIKGIANLAAVSGSTSQQASTAMYQLSQALASGTVKLMDWNSVVNAGMGGQVFQDALKETARLHGIAIDQMIKDEGSFRETLSNGWLTSTILTETLAKFTGDLTETQLKNMGYTEEQIASILKLGKTANEAATKVKTFTQLIDTLKEAAQSGWSQTWRILVGDFEKAKELFTEVSDALGAIIGKMSDARNNLLSGALSSKWSQLEEEIAKVGIPFDDFQTKLIETAKAHGFAIDQMIEQEGSLENTLKYGWLTSGIISETLRGYVSEISATNTELATIMESLAQFGDVVNQVIVGNFGNGEDRIKLLTEAGYDYAVIQDLVNKTLDGTIDDLKKLSEEQLKNIGFTEEQVEAIKLLAEEADKSGTSINKLIADLTKPSGRELLIDTFRNALKGLGQILGSIREAWKATFSPITSDQVYKVIESIHSLSERLELSREDTNKLTRAFKGLFAGIEVITTFTGGAFKAAIKLIAKLFGLADMPVIDLAAHLGDLLVKFRDWLFTNSIFAKAFDKITDAIVNAAIKVKEWFIQFKNLPDLETRLEKFGAVFVKIFGGFSTVLQNGIGLIKKLSARIVESAKKVKQWIDEFKSIPEVQRAINKFKTGVANSLEAIKKAFDACKKPFDSFFEKIKSIEVLTFEDVISAVKELAKQIIANFAKVGESFKSIPKAIETLALEVKIKLGKTWQGFDEFLTKIAYFVKSMRDRIGNIDLGGIILAALGIGTLTIGNKIGDALEALISPLEFVAEFNDLLKAFKFTAFAFGFTSLAAGILLLAASIVVLTLVDQTKLWSAVGAMAVLGIVLVALSKVMGEVDKGLVKTADNTKSIIILATSVLMLAAAIAILAKLDTDKLVNGLLTLVGVIAALAVVSVVLSKVSPTLFAGAGSLIAFAASVLILVIALDKISNINGTKLIGGLLVLVSIMATLALVSKICSTLDWKGLLSAVAVAIAFRILVKAIESMANIDVVALFNALIAFVPIITMLSALMLATKLAGANAASAGVGILAISLALIFMSTAIKQLANINAESLIAPVAVIAVLMGLISGLLAATKLAGENALQAGVMLLMMSGAIAILAVVIAVLSKLDPSGLGVAVAAIAALEVCFMGLIYVTKYAKALKGVKNMLIMLTVIVAVLAVALVVLSNIRETKVLAAAGAIAAVLYMLAVLINAVGTLPNVGTKQLVTLGIVTLIVAALGGILYLLADLNPGGALAVGASLSLLLVSIAAVCKLLGATWPPSTPSLVAVGVLTAIIAGLAAILYLLRDLDPESTLATSVGLSTLLLSLSASCAILSAVGTAAAPALAGVGVLAALIVAVGALMVGIGALVDKYPQIEEWMDGAIVIFEKIGYAFGALIGSIVGGLSAGIVSGLPDIADSLSLFMEKMQVFFAEVEKVPADTVNHAKTIAQTVSDVTSTILTNKITSVLGKTDLTYFSTQLSALGDAVVAFSSKVSGNIDAGSVNAAASAAQLLVEIATALPKTGGLWQSIVGEIDMSKFKTHMEDLAEGIVAFAGKVTGSDGNSAIDKNAVETAANAGKLLVELSTTIPKTGGLLQKIVGEGDLSNFKTHMENLGDGIVAFSSKVTGANGSSSINKNSVETASNAGKLLVELANTIPKTGGLLQKITGEMNLTNFATQLGDLADGIVTFASKVTGENGNALINKLSVETAANACELLIKLANTIPQSGGLFQKLTGEIDMAKFASQMGDLGDGIVGFSSKVTGADGKPAINTEAVKTAKNAGDILVTLSKTITDSVGSWIYNQFGGDNKKFENFNHQMPLLGEGIAAFSEKISGNVDADAVSAAASAGEIVAKLRSNVSESTGGWLQNFFGGEKSKFEAFKKHMPILGEAIVKFSEAIEDKVSVREVNAAASVGSLLASLRNNVSENTSNWLEALFSGDSSKFENFKKQLPMLGEAIVGFSNSVTGKIKSESVDSATIVSDIISALMDNLVSVDVKQIADFSTNVNKLKDTLLNLNGALNTISTPDLTNAVNFVTAISTEIGNWPKCIDASKLSNYSIAVKNVSGAIGDFYYDLEAINLNTFRAVLDVVDDLVNLTMDMAAVNTSGINAFGSSLYGLGSTGVSQFVSAFANAKGQIQSAANDMMTTFSNAVKDESNVSKAATAFGKVVTATLEVITGTSKNSAGAQNRESFKTAGNTVVSEFGSGISNKNSITNIETAISTIITAAINKLRHVDTRKQFSDAGTYLIEGFANGIASDIAKRKAESAAREVVRSTINAINDEAKINSPSKVTYESGEFMGIGLINALSDYADKSYDAGANLAESARVGLRNAIAKVVDSLEGDIDTEPTIRPVVDLTNVESGARRINTMFARSQVMSIDVGSRNSSDEIQNGATTNSGHGNVYNYTQNNYSPKALSRIEIYRQTRNQFSAMERMVEEHA